MVLHHWISRGDDCGIVGGAPLAQAPPRHFRLLDGETSSAGRLETRRVTDGAIHVLHSTAGPADQVMVIVAHPHLVPGGRASRLDTSEQTGSGQVVEDVVHPLTRDAELIQWPVQ